jgi:hypothetical protein
MENAPKIFLFRGNIRKCYGCKKDIEHEKLPFPHDVVIQLKADIQIKNMRTGQWFNTRSNIYFHPTITCLQKHNASLEARNLVIGDDTILQLHPEQLESLHCRGFLKYIVKNKLGTIVL